MRGEVCAVRYPILARFPLTRAQMVSKQAGDWTVLHCAHRATTALSWGLCEREGWSSCPLHFFAHVFPLLRHLCFARRLALGWFWHHHGVEAPLQKRVGKGLRAPHT